MRILTVLPDIPLPADTGLHLRMLGNLELIRLLGHESHLLFFSSEEEQGRLEFLESVGELVDGLAHAGLRRNQRDFGMPETLTYKLRFLSSGLLNRPGSTYPFSMRYDAISGLRTALDEARRVRAEFVVIPSIFLHWAEPLCQAGFRVIADSADLLTDLTREMVRHYSGSNPARRVSLLANALACATQERLFFPWCTEIWVTSTPEAERLRARCPSSRVVVLPNTVPDPGYARRTAGSLPVVGFLGTFSYLPNLEAARHLVTEIFPAIRDSHPSAVLRLGGAGLPEKIATQWRALPGVEVLGRVPSSVDFLNACTVVAFPITVRGGIPLKLVESLALGLPVVAYPELVATLPLVAGRDLEIAAGPDSFATLVAQLLSDQTRGVAVGRAGRKIFDAHFSRVALERAARAGSVLGPRVASPGYA